MRVFWVRSPHLLYLPYNDWSTTVLLQIIEFHLFLSAVSLNVSIGISKRLLAGTIVMLAFGYTSLLVYNPWLDFVVGMGGLVHFFMREP